MKRKLQYFLALLLMGVTGAWADDAKFSPTAEAQLRTQDSNNDTWDNNYVKTASDDVDVFEVNYRAGIFVLQTYEVDDLEAVKSLTLHLAGHKDFGTDAVAIWAFPTNEWTTSDEASTLAGYVNSTVGVDLHAESGSYSSTYLLKDMHTISTSDGDYRLRNFTIDGTALQTLKSRASGNKFTLLITNRTTEILKHTGRKMYTSSHATEAYHPYVSVQYAPAVVTLNGNKTLCETLNEAVNGIETGEGTITLYKDITITSCCNVTAAAKNVTIVPAKDGLTISSSLTNSILFLCNNGGTLTVGSAEHALTIDGKGVTNSSNHVEASGGTTTIQNVLLKDCTTSSTMGVICHKSGGSIYLKDVTFNNCTTTQSGRGIVFAGSTGLHLENTITFVDCNEYNFYQENSRYIHVGNLSEEQADIFTTFYQNATYKNIILSSSTGGDKSNLFKLMNEGYGIIKDPDHYTDHKITEAYTMTMNAYGASTLILPYDAKIPVYGDAAAYTLNYNTGNTVVRATEVETTIPANTPVLLNAAAGEKLWFVNTALVGSTTNNDGKNHTSGALTGVYTTTDVLPVGSYILYADESNPIGFYKSNNSTVAANRAYLTAEGAAARSITVVYDDDELTGIKSVESGKMQAEGVYYDLSGRRVAQPTKGLYIVNGKKVIIK